MHYTYLLINILIVALPVGISFFIKMEFYRKWKFAFLGIGFASMLFVAWDMIFTRLGIWKFNPAYTTGPHIYTLPWEEVLFFITVPYTCLYAYECLRVYFPGRSKIWIGKLFGWGIVLLCLITLYYRYDQLFTSVTAILLLVTYLNHLWVTKGDYLNHLLVAWMVVMVPMALVDGFITGLPIIQYDSAQITNLRIGPIPVELFFYNLLYLTWMIWVYERYKQRPYWKQMEREARELRKLERQKAKMAKT